MALKTLIQFPFFAPPNPTHHRPSTEVRFSLWNNANAQKFIRHERTQKEIEDELRLLKRFNSADKIANTHDPSTSTSADTFRSVGTPSTPSRPSIPGKRSKYSKSPRNSRNTHPAFRRFKRVLDVPGEAKEAETGLKVGEDGVSYVLPDAPFAFQYSYTETPKVKPLKLREPPIAPFGPGTMPRPWTGRKPLPPGKKKVEFDSFRLPPPHKKGVKPVQAPGPFLPGSGPKYVKSREEILGEPLTKEEISDLVAGCMKSKRQLNMGRDGLTHNMLDNIHALWKRRRVCKIKCKGVCTVDMDNVRQQLEEKSGGKVIHNKGGVIYLFRGRNYNYKTRPKFPLMLWKPITPVYPRLVQRVPEGLTLEEASEMRKKGRILTPICKLGKNGVYCDLVKNVREAFEACELVRINCQGMNGSDYRKIGAKLKDLVPCVLISFEREHILMWRGRDWKSSLSKLGDDSDNKNSAANPVIAPPFEGQVETELSTLKSEEEHASLEKLSTTSPICMVDAGMEADENIETPFESQAEVLSCTPKSEDEHTSPETLSTRTSSIYPEDVGIEAADSIAEVDRSSLVCSSVSNMTNVFGSETASTSDESETLTDESHGSKAISHNTASNDDDSAATQVEYDTSAETAGSSKDDSLRLTSPWSEKVIELWKEAIECGSAVVLDNSSLDSDTVYSSAVALAQSAPPGPVFRRRPRKVAAQKVEQPKTEDAEVKEVKLGGREVKEAMIVSKKGESGRKSLTKTRMKGIKGDYLDVVPQGSLGVDELAKLLA